MVQGRYGYGTGTYTGTVRLRYGDGAGTENRAMYRTDRARTMYPNSGRNRSRSATIFAAIWVHGTGKVGTVHGENRTHVPYPCAVYPPYPCIVPAPYLYRTRTCTRTQTRTNRPVPIIWRNTSHTTKNSKIRGRGVFVWVFCYVLMAPWHATVLATSNGWLKPTPVWTLHRGMPIQY